MALKQQDTITKLEYKELSLVQEGVGAIRFVHTCKVTGSSEGKRLNKVSFRGWRQS